MANPIGVNFLPSEENSAMGLQRSGKENAVGQAVKILSLNLQRPRVYGAKSPSPLLGGQGASGFPFGAIPGAGPLRPSAPPLGPKSPFSQPQGPSMPSPVAAAFLAMLQTIGQSGTGERDLRGPKVVFNNEGQYGEAGPLPVGAQVGGVTKVGESNEPFAGAQSPLGSYGSSEAMYPGEGVTKVGESTTPYNGATSPIGSYQSAPPSLPPAIAELLRRKFGFGR